MTVIDLLTVIAAITASFMAGYEIGRNSAKK